MIWGYGNIDDDWKPGEEARFNERVDERLADMLADPCGLEDEDYWEALMEIDSLPHLKALLYGEPEEGEAAALSVRTWLSEYLRPRAEAWVRDRPDV